MNFVPPKRVADRLPDHGCDPRFRRLAQNPHSAFGDERCGKDGTQTVAERIFLCNGNNRYIDFPRRPVPLLIADIMLE